jgi:guanylate kinase
MPENQLTVAEADRLRGMLLKYRPRDEVKKACEGFHFGVIIGPAGSGKDTLRQALLRCYPAKYSLLLSDTSRAPRITERDGVEYHFKSLKDMLTGFKRGDYLQGAVVHGQQLSGVNGKDLLNLQSNTMPLSIFVIQTVEELQLLGFSLRGIFLLPPSLADMKERLSVRQGITQAEQERRLKTAKTELELALAHNDFQFLVTRTIQHSLEVSSAFLESGVVNQAEQFEARKVASSLLEELAHYH